MFLSVIIAAWSLNLALGNSNINEKIAQYNKELIDWYKNPQVILQSWNSAESEVNSRGRFIIDTSILNNYSLEKGIESDISYSRKIDFWVYNSGRKPLTDTRMSISIDVEEPPTASVPFKFYEIITPGSTLKFDAKNKQMIQEFEGVIPIFVNSHNKSDFPPVVISSWENGTSSLWKTIFPTSFQMGNIGPGEVINFHVSLFSTRDNVNGTLICNIHGNKNEVQEIINVPIQS